MYIDTGGQLTILYSQAAKTLKLVVYQEDFPLNTVYGPMKCRLYSLPELALPGPEGNFRVQGLTAAVFKEAAVLRPSLGLDVLRQGRALFDFKGGKAYFAWSPQPEKKTNP